MGEKREMIITTERTNRRETRPISESLRRDPRSFWAETGGGHESERSGALRRCGGGTAEPRRSPGENLAETGEFAGLGGVGGGVEGGGEERTSMVADGRGGEDGNED